MNEMPDEVDHADQRKKIEEAFLKKSPFKTLWHFIYDTLPQPSYADRPVSVRL
ncbi:MAG: hypothetical protein LQ344_002747 [Seirophora lacunosa]|nr:MAG: hypothetical protein LQ344_002747 [Seirophora lacunosa]